MEVEHEAEGEIGILQRTERSMVRAMHGVQLKHRKRTKDLKLMSGLNETTDQCCWHGDVLRREMMITFSGEKMVMF